MLSFGFLRQFSLLFVLLGVLTGCVGNFSQTAATPAQLQAIAPEPIPDNSGKYLSPFTSDDVVAEWVNKAINAKMGAAVGSQVGAYAGRKAMENVPFVGGMLGQKVGDAAGRKIAIEASGGMEYIRSTSDLSFDTAKDLSVYIYANFGTSEHYADVLSATMEIYPELKKTYYQYIANANRQAAQMSVQ